MIDFHMCIFINIGNIFVPNIFHICFSPFGFSIIKTYDGNSGVTHYLPTQNVIHKIILLPNATNPTRIAILQNKHTK